MTDPGKGDSPRPLACSRNEYEARWERTFRTIRCADSDCRAALERIQNMDMYVCPTCGEEYDGMSEEIRRQRGMS